MKTNKIISIIILLCLSQTAVTQSTNKNYILTQTYTNEAGTSSIDVIQYLDGLGRLTQTVSKKMSPDQKDVVTYQEYDGFGRESNAWLPRVTNNNNGAFVDLTAMEKLSASCYQNDTKPYAKPVYESSPLNRITEQYGAGADWHNNSKSVKTAYMNNTTSGELACINYSVTGSGTNTKIANAGNFAPNLLYVTKITDEDGNVSYEFKDKLDRVVLARQINDGLNDTYYVYNNFGKLCYVLQPECGTVANGSSDDCNQLKRFAFLYKYDERNRCISKRLPGADWIEYVYDKADQLIFMQDGEMRKKNTSKHWYYTIPDALGRTVLEGVCFSKPDISNIVVTAEYVGNVAGNIAGYKKNIVLGMANVSLPQYYKANYYDNYRFKSMWNNPEFDYKTKIGNFVDKRYGTDNDLTKSKGLMTGQIVCTMGTTVKELKTVLYYDEKGHPIQTIAQNHLNGYEKEYVNYSFTGKPKWQQKIHSAPGKESITEVYSYNYDHADRLTNTVYGINNSAPMSLYLTYDEIGRMAHKGIYNSEIINYTYNVRSWLKTIDSNNFKQTLYYNDGANKRYNGNIGELTTQQDIMIMKKGYIFEYDRLNRLVAANHTQNRTYNGAYDESLEYDKNGNITRITRKEPVSPAEEIPDDFPMKEPNDMGTLTNKNSGDLTAMLRSGTSQGSTVPLGNTNSQVFTQTTTLRIESEGNQMRKIISGSKIYGVNYNLNGSLIKDDSRGITNIQYNYLNLPKTITFNTQNKTSFLYDANGMKRQVKHITRKEFDYIGETMITLETFDDVAPKLSLSSAPPDDNTAVNPFEETTTTDYCGNIIYEDGVLKYVLNSEGYAMKNTDGTWAHHYYLRDHLGNNRAVVQNTTTIQRTDYYPFGKSHSDGFNPELQPYKYGNKELDEMHGLNQYDFVARSLPIEIPVFDRIDPLAELYYPISPYAYCANNPIKYMDLRGDSLTLAGNATDIQSTVNTYNTGLGGYYTTSADANGKMSIAPVAGTDPNNMTTEQKAFYSTLNRVVSGTDGVTTINVANGTSDIIGNINTATIDIGDIQALGNGNDVNQGSALMHETWEQYQVQVKGSGQAQAHISAAGVENAVTGSRVDPVNRFISGGQLPVNVLDHSGNVVRTVIIHINSSGNVTGITR
ncbi:MAG: DUF6443 domain-containing protein [Dysgonamonadaceae bacterium]|jgi:RHS repeat-associated protein|nr:DUF6443 domain-containing protein [Dysgonamonadaceae bacterium]